MRSRGEGAARLEAVVAHGFGEAEERVLDGLAADDLVAEYRGGTRAGGGFACREDDRAGGVVDLGDRHLGGASLGGGVLGLGEDDLVAGLWYLGRISNLENRIRNA